GQRERSGGRARGPRRRDHRNGHGLLRPHPLGKAARARAVLARAASGPARGADDLGDASRRRNELMARPRGPCGDAARDNRAAELIRSAAPVRHFSFETTWSIPACAQAASASPPEPAGELGAPGDPDTPIAPTTSLPARIGRPPAAVVILSRCKAPIPVGLAT